MGKDIPMSFVHIFPADYSLTYDVNSGITVWRVFFRGGA